MFTLSLLNESIEKLSSVNNQPTIGNAKWFTLSTVAPSDADIKNSLEFSKNTEIAIPRIGTPDIINPTNINCAAPEYKTNELKKACTKPAVLVLHRIPKVIADGI